jgi:zinc/manganese transport system substrate-binding protein
MKRSTRALCMALLCLLLAGSIALPAFAKIDVVAATPELADITKQVGGNMVSVYSVAKPNQDYHMIEPRPSDVSRIAKADMLVRIGLDLDMWLDSLINAAGNSRVRKGASGYVDASAGVPKLEVPREQITGASGDIHVYGNPHYFYDPENGKTIAHNVLEGLIRVDSRDKAEFKANYEAFAAEIDRRTAAWKKELAPYKGHSVVTYHASAVYFLHRFGLKDFGQLEPKPGIPPSPAHVANLIKRMKEDHVKAVAIESVYPKRFPDLIKRETGADYVVVPYSVGSLGTKNYFDLIDRWVSRYKEALR